MTESEKLAEEARQAFEEWKQVHTWENRTPKEMFLFGFYAARMKEST